MASVVRIWEVGADDALNEVAPLAGADIDALESQIEDWIVSDPATIDDDLLLIGRQVRTDSGPLDLLGVLSDGRLVIIELKRDRTPRETVAQALDYTSWVALQSPERIRSLAESYLGADFLDAFRDHFDQEAPELNLTTPAIRVVGSRLDAATERMISHLSTQYGMDINGIVLRHVTLSTGERLLTRVAVATETGGTSDRAPYWVSPEELIRFAKERKVLPIVQVLRTLGEFLSENPTRTFGGSFRYWAFSRMLCGVNVTGNWDVPSGSVGVWVSYRSWAEITDRDEKKGILAPLTKAGFEQVRDYERSHRMVYRIGSVKQAEEFVGVLREWFGEPEE